MRLRPALAYHQLLGRLGVGDLHPGGAQASRRILAWLEARLPRGARVLEGGAGVGRTAARLASRFAVTALEPDPVLFERLRGRPRLDARRERLDEHEGDPYDALVLESVLAQLGPVDDALARARALLRPRGLVALSEMLHTASATEADARRLAEDSVRRFGIACAPAALLTLPSLRAGLARAGLELVAAERLGPGSPGTASGSAWREVLARPGLLPGLVWYRLEERRRPGARGLLESWLLLARAGDDAGAGAGAAPAARGPR